MAGSSKKVVIAALTGNSLIAVTKFVAAGLTGSPAMFSEAVHSVADTGNQGLLLYGMKAAKRPPDQDHPFGYGKEIYFWSLIVAVMLFAVGAGVSLYHGVSHVWEILAHGGHHSEQSFLVNYIVLSLALVFESGACWIALREFNKDRGELGFFEAVEKGKDPSMFVVLFEDIGAGLGLIIALVGVALTDLTGNPIYDASASICIGILLAVASIWLATEVKGLLIGEAARTPVVDEIRNIIGDYDEITHTNELLTMHMGPETIVATISVDFGDDFSADDVEGTVTELGRRIKDEFPTVKRVFIEAESWKDHQPQIGEKPTHDGLPSAT